MNAGGEHKSRSHIFGTISFWDLGVKGCSCHQEGAGTCSLCTVLPLLLLGRVSDLCIAAVLHGFVGSGKVNCKSIAFFFFLKQLLTCHNLCQYLHTQFGTALFLGLFIYFFPLLGREVTIPKVSSVTQQPNTGGLPLLSEKGRILSGDGLEVICWGRGQSGSQRSWRNHTKGAANIFIPLCNAKCSLGSYNT